MRRALFASLLLTGCLVSGCVVSTQAGPGVEPLVPVPPEVAARSEPTSHDGEPFEVHARHILIQYKGADHARPYVTRTKEEASAFAEELRERILGGEDFAELASEYSDDAGSAVSGGDLGKFRREQMVPEFADAAFALEPGGIANVVESAFGFHVIQRLE